MGWRIRSSDTDNEIPKYASHLEYRASRIVGVYVDHDKIDLSNMIVIDDNGHVNCEMPNIVEPLPYIGSNDVVDEHQINRVSGIFDDYASDDSDGNTSIGEDFVHSAFLYDSDGQYYDELFEKEVEKVEEVKITKLKEKGERGKRPVSQGKNEKFDTYEGKCKTQEYKGYEVFNPMVDMEEVKMVHGMCFSSVEVFRAAIRKHAVDEGRSLAFPTNNPKKVSVKCADRDCPFFVFASKDPNEHTFQIRSLHFEHECTRQSNVTQADTKFLVGKYCSKLKSNPKWNVKSMLEISQNECKVQFSKHQVYRAKKMVGAMDIGDGGEQFGMLRAYAEEILQSNPGSTVKIKVKIVGYKNYFKRMYICWSALKSGMLDGCRKMICLDGCHVRTEYGGMILIAIGIDANNGLYPFAYAVLEKEKKKSWLWFLDLVKSDMGITNCSECTIMSDKQKGLVDAVSEKFDGCEHRFCVMHLYSNFKLQHKGLALKLILWRAAKATRVVDFDKVMEELKQKDEKAYEWLEKRPPQHWSKAHFETSSKSDLILNNLSESYNGSITRQRALPILHMLEGIRMQLMEKIGEKGQKMMKYRGKICPRIAKMFEENMKMAMEFTPHWNGHEEFNVQRSEFGDTYKVHLREGFCSCRKWQLTGIPCAHAIAGINMMKYKPEDYIDQCYNKETYLRIYSHYIMPLASHEEWPKPSEKVIEILPPIIEKQPGRPKLYNRKLQPGETKGKVDPVDKQFGKMSRKGGTITCGDCKEVGHNIRSCPNRLRGGVQLDIPAPNITEEHVTEFSQQVPKATGKGKKKQETITRKNKIGDKNGSDEPLNLNINQKQDADSGVVMHLNTTSTIPIVPNAQGKKLDVKRKGQEQLNEVRKLSKVQAWLDYSKNGSNMTSLSQPASSGSHAKHVVDSVSYLSQPDKTLRESIYSKTFGQAKFSQQPGRGTPSYKTVEGEEEAIFRGD
ncbi:hypothetical protein OROHE_026209 [Orobanche hederae]